MSTGSPQRESLAHQATAARSCLEEAGSRQPGELPAPRELGRTWEDAFLPIQLARPPVLGAVRLLDKLDLVSCRK